MEHVIGLIEEMMETLSDTARSEVVMGKEIEFGTAKIVPLSKVSIGFGGGGGEGDGGFRHHKERKSRHKGDKGSGAGGGGGARIRPVGVIIFTEDTVRVEAVPDNKGVMDRIFNRIPDIIDMAKKHRHDNH